jgi:hypothetical protein
MANFNSESQDLFEDEHCNSIQHDLEEGNKSMTDDGIGFAQPPIDHTSPPSTSVMMMNSYFDFVYAKALHEVKGLTVRKHCYGCEINHPSQKEHDCIMISDDEEYQIEFYFNNMIKDVNEQDIIKSWEEIMEISNISPEIIHLHKRVISSKDFLTVMKTKQWKSKMIRMVLTIGRLEERLFRTSL